MSNPDACRNGTIPHTRSFWFGLDISRVGFPCRGVGGNKVLEDIEGIVTSWVLAILSIVICRANARVLCQRGVATPVALRGIAMIGASVLVTGITRPSSLTGARSRHTHTVATTVQRALVGGAVGTYPAVVALAEALHTVAMAGAVVGASLVRAILTDPPIITLTLALHTFALVLAIVSTRLLLARFPLPAFVADTPAIDAIPLMVAHLHAHVWYRAVVAFPAAVTCALPHTALAMVSAEIRACGIHVALVSRPAVCTDALPLIAKPVV